MGDERVRLVARPLVVLVLSIPMTDKNMFPDTIARAPLSGGVDAGVGYLLHDEAYLRQVAVDAVTHAGSISAAHAAAYVTTSGGLLVRTNGQALSGNERHGSQMLTVVLTDNGRRGQASTTIFSNDTIRETVVRAAAILEEVEGDPEVRPVDPELLARDERNIPLFAHSGRDTTDLQEIAHEIDAAARAAIASDGDRARVVQTSVSSDDSAWAHAMSDDFLSSGANSMQSNWTRIVASLNHEMAGDHWASQERRIDDLLDARTLAETAVHRASRKLGGRSIGPRECPVLFDAPVAAMLPGSLVAALTGGAQHTGSTFLHQSLGKAVLAQSIDLVEDPFAPWGHASGPHDGEGVAGLQRHIVSGGEVQGYFLSARSARQLGMVPTGNAGGPWNLSLTSRGADRSGDTAAMLRKLDRGLWITEILGGAADPVTGAWSYAVGGFWVDNGVPVHPAQDITAASTLQVMFAGIQGVGSDTYRSGAITTGSILIDRMRISGR